jgi:flagellar protein FlbD
VHSPFQIRLKCWARFAEGFSDPPPPAEEFCMIQLTRLNNTRLAVNSDLIKYVEEAPDTVITLLNGEKLVVRETTEQVIERVLDFRRCVLTASSEGAAQTGDDDARPSRGPDPASPTREGPVHG